MVVFAQLTFSSGFDTKKGEHLTCNISKVLKMERKNIIPLIIINIL